jgi:hypothetical protein
MSNAYWLNTFTGRRFNFLEPKHEDIDIVDIALALSRQARYAGHTKRHYSVAEHSVIVSCAVQAIGPANLDAQRWGLMHDAAEAYCTDVPWPIKAAGLVPELIAAEKRIMGIIAERFGLSAGEPALVKEVDLEMLDIEASLLLSQHADWPAGTPREARPETRNAFYRMQKERQDWAFDFVDRASMLGLASDFDMRRLRGLLA